MLRRIILLCVLAGFLFAMPAAALNPLSVAGYIAECKRLATSLTLEQLKADIELYPGKYIELRGAVTGFAQSGDDISIVVSDYRGQSFFVKVDEKMEDGNNVRIACLVKMGPGCLQDLTDLQLVAWTYEADVVRYEEAKRAEALARTARTTSRAAAKPREPQVVLADSVEDFIQQYSNRIRAFNSKISKAQADEIATAILHFSDHYKVDPRLVMAVIVAESRFRTNAVSYAGAMGLGQLMPSTAAGLGVSNAFDPVDNLYGSIRYIRSMIDRTSGKPWEQMTWRDLSLALAAYNAGPNAVKKHGGIPPYKQTQNYINKVTALYKQFCGVK